MFDHGTWRGVCEGDIITFIQPRTDLLSCLLRLLKVKNRTKVQHYRIKRTYSDFELTFNVRQLKYLPKDTQI